MTGTFIHLSRRDILKHKPVFIQSLISYDQSDDDEAISKKAHCSICKYTRLTPIPDRRVWKCPTCGIETPFATPVRRSSTSKLVVADKSSSSARGRIFEQKESMKRDVIASYKEKRRQQAHELDDELEGQGYTITNIMDVVKPSNGVIDSTILHHSKGLKLKQQKPGVDIAKK